MHGRIDELSEDDYFGDRSKSSASSIETFIRERREYHRRYVLGEPEPPPTQAMIRGKYGHALVLEPDTVKDRFVVMPRSAEDPLKPIDRRTKAGKEAWADFVESTKGKIAVHPVDADWAVAAVKAIGEHPEAAALLFGDGGMNERSLAWIDEATGRHMKARPDRLLVTGNAIVIVELKTDRDIDPFDGRNQTRWWELGYHRKAAVYLDGCAQIFSPLPILFRWVFVEDDPKPRVCVREMPRDSIAVQIGRMEYRRALEQIEACEASGDWREDWEKGVQPYQLPGWVEAQAMHLEGIEDA